MSRSQSGRAGRSSSIPTSSPRPLTATTGPPLKRSQLVEKHRAEPGRPLDELLVREDAQRGPRDRAAQRIASIGAAVTAGDEDIHDLAPADDRGHRIEPARQRLSQDIDIGPDRLVIAGEPRPGASEAGLDLVGHEQHVVLRGSSPPRRARYPAGGMMTPASHWIGSTRKPQVFAVMAASSAEMSPYGMVTKPGVNGPNPCRCRWIGRDADERRRTAVKISGADDDLGAAVRDPLPLDSPTGGQP